MEKILFQKEILEFLKLPSIPKKKFEVGGKSFKNGVAITSLMTGASAYAVCSYDSEVDEKPRIVKTFAREPFTAIKSIFIVPDYMDNDVDDADLDEDSKEAAKRLADEATELETPDEDGDKLKEMLGEGEWIFPNITNEEEAVAFIKAYNEKNKISGRLPRKTEAIKLRLLAIYNEQKEK